MSLYATHFQQLSHKVNHFLDEQALNTLILFSGEQTYIYADDQTVPWKMPACLRYFIYEDLGPHAVLVVQANQMTLYLYQPNDFWYAAPSQLQGDWMAHIECQVFHCLDDLKNAVSNLEMQRAIYLGPDDSYLNPSLKGRAQPASALQINLINEWRVHKTAFEIENIKQANVIAAKGHVAAKESFDEGVSEFDIHLDYLSVSGQTEENLPYHNIIALNHHAATLHYQYVDHIVPNAHHTFLIDAGYQYRGYASDITRTHIGNQLTNDVLTGLLEGLRYIKLSVIERCVKGASWVEIHAFTHALIAHLLVKTGVIHNIDPKTAYESKMTHVFFPHGIGHFLGLQVHDVGGFQDGMGNELQRDETHPFLRVVRYLEVGMVLTVEPGIYFIPSLLAKARCNPQYADYLNQPLIDILLPFGGMRDEDNIVITEGPARNLTAEAFSEIGYDGF